jgi:L-fuconolactonase
MEIIDAQIHKPLPLEPWRSASGECAVEATVEMSVHAMEAVGVDRAVIYSTAEYCRLASSRYGDKRAGVLSFRHPSEIEDPAAFVEDLKTQPGLIGIRVLGGIADNWRLVADGLWEPLISAAERQRLPVVFWLPLQLRLIHAVVRKHPDLYVIVDHLGMPTPPNPALSGDVLETLPDLLDLAAYPNVAVKFTGVPALTTERYPYHGLWSRLYGVLEAFGPERLLWGSDYTRVMGRNVHPRNAEGRSNYAELVNFLRYANEIGEADKAMMFSGSIRAWFGWPD